MSKKYLPEGYEEQRQLLKADGTPETHEVVDPALGIIAEVPLYRPRYGAVRAFIESLPKAPIPQDGEGPADVEPEYYVPVESYDSAFAAVCAILPEDMSRYEKEEVFLLSGAANGDLARKAFGLCTARKERPGDNDPTI